jgi:cation transport regulator ChaC
MDTYYFAYGSNMAYPRIRARVGSARPMGVFELPGHQLRFHKIGADGSAKCNALFTGRGSDLVQGVVFRVRTAEIGVLDHAEDLGRGYAMRTVLVSDREAGAVAALAYFALLIDDRLRPFHWYKHHVLEGARSAGLCRHYRRRIERVKSVRDPDAGRARRELAIHGL